METVDIKTVEITEASLMRVILSVGAQGRRDDI